MSEAKRIGNLNCVILNQSATPQCAVILCHGFGAPGTDLVAIGDELIRTQPALANIAFIFPQAPIELDPHFDSRAWWMIDIEKIQTLMAQGEFRELRSEKPKDLEARRKDIFGVIEQVMKDFELPPEKIIVGGFSQGAMLTTEVALHFPEPLGGLIVWSGTILNEEEWTAAAKNKSAFPVVLSHGRTDPILPIGGAEVLKDMLIEASHDVTFVPFDGEHTISIEGIREAAKMLMNTLN